MKLNIPEIRKRLSNNTAIKEIQALCDEVEKIEGIFKELERFQQEDILHSGIRISFVSMGNIKAIFKEFGYEKEPEF